MRTVALISGGKDSCFNMLHCVAAGHEIVALANLRPNDTELYEIDSYMYQTVGHDVIDLYSEAMGLPLYREYIQGTSLQIDSDYIEESQDEVEDLYRLLARVKEMESIEAVSVGAILSNYQRVRVENVCKRLKLVSLAYLWQRDQDELLNDIIQCRVEAVLIKVAALGLDPAKYLGKSLQSCQKDLQLLNQKYGLHICGEGGEYETLTLDCPLFRKRIKIEEMESVAHTKDPIAPVAYLKFNHLRLIDKEGAGKENDLQLRIRNIPVKKPAEFCLEELNSISDVTIDVHCQRGRFVNVENGEFSISIREDSGMLSIGGLVAESENDMLHTMDTLKEILEKRNYCCSSLVSVCLYIRDMAEYVHINEIYSRYFGLNPPVRVCVQSPIKSYALIEAVAFPHLPQKRVMHIQSISHWAPANIGPYSQCIEVKDLLFVSGQIGLIPGSMTLPTPANFASECRLSLRHCTRLLNAMDADINLTNAIQAVCFVCDEAHIGEAKSFWKDYGGEENVVTFVVVSCLPKNALVEWQIWAYRSWQSLHHRYQAVTSSTEKLAEIQTLHSQELTTLLCSIDEVSLNEEGFKKVWLALIDILGDCCTLRIYYRVDCDFSCWSQIRESIPKTISVTLVPVWNLDCGRAAVICGMKY